MKTNVELLMDEVREVFPNSKYFIALLEKYMIGNKYRGKHNLQQERKNIDQLIIFLKLFKKHSNEDGSMFEAPGDHRPDPQKDLAIFNLSKNYLDFVDEINLNIDYMRHRLVKHQVRDQFKTIKKQTLKNLFDIGEIFSKYKELPNGKIKNINPGESAKGKGNTFYKLNENLSKLLDGPEIEVSKYLSRRIKLFFEKNTNSIIKFLLDEEVVNFGIKGVERDIFSLTLSYYGKENIDGLYPSFDLVKRAYIEAHLYKDSFIKVVGLFDKYSKLTKQEDKNNGKIDWSNFKNQTNTLFSYLSLTSTFELNKNKRYINLSLKNIGNIDWPKRSLKQKNLYFENHKIDKGEYLNFELHHSYPLAYAETPEEFQFIDDWKNLIYISPNGHSMFPKRNNYWTEISDIEKDRIVYESIIGEEPIVFKNKEDVAYNHDLSKILIDYNMFLNKKS